MTKKQYAVMSIKTLTIFGFLCCFVLHVQAQGTFQPKAEDNTSKGIIYNKEFAINFVANTGGYGFGVDVGRLQTYYKTRYYHFGIGELKHPREKRSDFQGPTRANTIAARSFVFGKQNSLYAFRAGIGTKRYLSEKSKDKGVAIGINYEIGPTLGLLKPYYLEVYVLEPESISRQTTRSVRYTPETAQDFSDISRIFGASSPLKGFGELKPTMGLHGKFSVHFDWGAFDEFVKALDVGIMVDGFFNKTPILLDGVDIDTEAVENRNVFINLYVKASFGKRR